MRLDSFQVRDGDLVGFADGTTGRQYAVHFNIEVFRSCWESKGITLNDLLDGKAYCETSVRNTLSNKASRFVRR